MWMSITIVTRYNVDDLCSLVIFYLSTVSSLAKLVTVTREALAKLINTWTKKLNTNLVIVIDRVQIPTVNHTNILEFTLDMDF